jgi:hypothetical protein
VTFWCNRMTADRYRRTVPPLARVLSRMVLQPRGLLCGDAEKCLAVQPVAWQHGEPTGSSSSDGDVLFARVRSIQELVKVPGAAATWSSQQHRDTRGGPP